MNRYAPELALVAGGLLGVVFGGFVLVSVGEFYSAAIVCALFGYPFAAYAVYNDTEPTTVLWPWLVTAISGLAAIGIVVDVLRLFSPSLKALLFGVFLGLLVFLPVAAYAAQYGSPPGWLAPRPVEAGSTVLAVSLLVAGLSTGTAVWGAASALLVFVAGTVFAAHSTGISSRRQRRLPVAGLLLAASLLGTGVFTGGSLDPWVTASLAAVFGPLISVALTANFNR
jgi:hypothetical protein